MAEVISKDDFMFHPVHGLCRVSAISKSEQLDECRYILLPVTKSRNDINFSIPKTALGDSGFNKLISAAEGKAIFAYFKSGDAKMAGESHAWRSAQLILSESISKESGKDSRRQTQLDRAVRSLVNELALVLKMNLSEVSRQMQGQLKRLSTINPLVASAFAKIYKEQHD